MVRLFVFFFFAGFLLFLVGFGVGTLFNLGSPQEEELSSVFKSLDDADKKQVIIIDKSTFTPQNVAYEARVFALDSLLGVDYEKTLSKWQEGFRKSLAEVIFMRKVLVSFVCWHDRSLSSRDLQGSCLRLYNSYGQEPSFEKHRFQRQQESFIIEAYLGYKSKYISHDLKVSQKRVFPPKRSFHVDSLYDISQIVVATERDARKLALQLSPKNFFDMARKYSISPRAKLGESVALIERGEWRSVFDGVFSLKKGKISEMISSTYGFHFFLVKEKPQVSLGKAKTLERVRNQMKQQQVREQQLRMLMAQAFTHVYMDIRYL